MMVGKPSIFAIESCIKTAYSRLGFRALGSFLIHIQGHRYGVQDPEATMLACSFDEVERRIKNRGMHTAPLLVKLSPSEIAETFRRLYYSDNSDDDGLANSDNAFFSKHIVWAPDGDSAFDDGSYILQFDIADNVRLVAFKAATDSLFDSNTLREVVIKADDFYTILEQWHEQFLTEWTALPQLLD